MQASKALRAEGDTSTNERLGIKASEAVYQVVYIYLVVFTSRSGLQWLEITRKLPFKSLDLFVPSRQSSLYQVSLVRHKVKSLCPNMHQRPSAVDWKLISSHNCTGRYLKKQVNGQQILVGPTRVSLYHDETFNFTYNFQISILFHLRNEHGVVSIIGHIGALICWLLPWLLQCLVLWHLDSQPERPSLSCSAASWFVHSSLLRQARWEPPMLSPSLSLSDQFLECTDLIQWFAFDLSSRWCGPPFSLFKLESFFNDVSRQSGLVLSTSRITLIQMVLSPLQDCSASFYTGLYKAVCLWCQSRNYDTCSGSRVLLFHQPSSHCSCGLSLWATA